MEPDRLHVLAIPRDVLEVAPSSTIYLYVLSAKRSGVPAVCQFRPASVIVVDRDLAWTSIKYQLFRSIHEGRLSVLVGPEVDRECTSVYLLRPRPKNGLPKRSPDQGAPLGERYLRFMKERLVEDVSTTDPPGREPIPLQGDLDLDLQICL